MSATITLVTYDQVPLNRMSSKRSSLYELNDEFYFGADGWPYHMPTGNALIWQPGEFGWSWRVILGTKYGVHGGVNEEHMKRAFKAQGLEYHVRSV